MEGAVSCDQNVEAVAGEAYHYLTKGWLLFIIRETTILFWRQNVNTVISLNGSVHSQGIKIDHRAWTDMGSEEWKNTPDADKAAAYQAAKICGWTDRGLSALIIKEFSPRIDQFMADVTIETLQELAANHPVEVQEVYEVKKENPQFKVKGSEATFQLPK
jgi:hypothetical protein